MTSVPSPFIHFRLASTYSLAQSSIKLDALIEACVHEGMPAVAVSDEQNLFGALEFSTYALSKGIQAIHALQLNVDFGPDFGMDKLLLIAPNLKAFTSLMKLSSLAFFQGQNAHQPFVHFEQLQEHESDVFAASGSYISLSGRMISHGQVDKALKVMDRYHDHFGDRFFGEIIRHNQDDLEQAVEKVILPYLSRKGIPPLASNQVYFLERSGHEAQEILACIHEGKTVFDPDRPKSSVEQYFKSSIEMAALFEDIPIAYENTCLLARCCHYFQCASKPVLPRFPSKLSEEDELRRQAQEGLEHRLKGQITEAYVQRLQFELDCIVNMGFSGYFLIVANFIAFAKKQDIPVGPGRGSGAGSLVAYALGITELDPLAWNLLFERFLNPERVSMPDFDIDFCQDRRDEVIQYVLEFYGADSVAHIITFGKLQAKAVIRDVGRVLAMPYSFVDRISKMIPFNAANPVGLQDALDGDQRLKDMYDQEDEVRRLFDIALELEGLYRHASTHAAGVVIGDGDLVRRVPLYYDPNSSLPVTQYSMKWVEAAGLVKFDFLGLKTLSVLKLCERLVQEQGGKVDFAQVSLMDPKVYDTFSSGHAVGIFQCESAGMQDVLRKLQPDRFEEIIAVVALYRPGPMDNIPSFIERKHGREKIHLAHPLLQKIVSETYGIMIYQEQVMQAAQVLAGYSLGEADLLRRAMGKKIKKEMDDQEARFTEGAAQNDIKAKDAREIFQLIAKFAGYGFNKSHAAAYALIAYQTAYAKTYHSLEFMAALMCYDSGNLDRIFDFKEELDRLGFALLPPCVQYSLPNFAPENGAVRYGLTAIKNLGGNAAQDIVTQRQQGLYKDLCDFLSRIDPKVLNKRGLEALIWAGALDCFGYDRGIMANQVEAMLAYQQRAHAVQNSDQVSLFGGASGQENLPKFKLNTSFSTAALSHVLSQEFDFLGIYLSGHPMQAYAAVYKALNIKTFRQSMEESQGQARRFTLLVMVQDLVEKRSAKGNKFAFLHVMDLTGNFEAMMFSDALEKYRPQLVKGKIIILHARMDAKEGDNNPRMLVDNIEDVGAYIHAKMPQVKLAASPDVIKDVILPVLSKLNPGGCKILMATEVEKHEVVLSLGSFTVQAEHIAQLAPYIQ